MESSNSNAQYESQDRSDFEFALDNGFLWLTRIVGFGVAAILIWIIIQITLQAVPAIQQFGARFITQSAWNPIDQTYGVLPMVYGTIVSSIFALLLAVPIAIGCAIILSENFFPRSVQRVFVFAIELLAAIPSVVYGLWGIYILIPFLRGIGSWIHNYFGWIPLFSTQPIGPGMFPAGVILSIMILPIITAISRDSLVSLPPELRGASYAVGSTRWQTIFSVLIPAAFSGIIGGVMLGLGRALGETMAVTMVIGNSNNLNISIFAPGNTIASLIASQFPEADDLQRSALMYAALILFATTLIVNVLAEWIVNRVKKY
ncbi:MAG: phosphate ABC transporter permease subunit PstC [Oscillatoriales cyanobacterium RM2_1_1]|nr:phosphate ABC transporter permease subunit PstC [Oscillatoriales cyanobacterium RM2_1_1]